MKRNLGVAAWCAGALLAASLAGGCRTAEPPPITPPTTAERAARYDKPAGEDRHAAFRELTWEEMGWLQKTGYVIVWPVGKLLEGLAYGVEWVFE